MNKNLLLTINIFLFSLILPFHLISQVVCIPIDTSSDDAEEHNTTGVVNLTSSDIDMVTGSNPQVVGLRFNNINIPNGAILSEAYIQFTADEVLSEPADLTIKGEDVDNSAIFTSDNLNISSRARTVDSVNWIPSSWDAIGDATDAQKTPDLSSILIGITERPGFVSGNSISFIISGSGKRAAESFDSSPQQAPTLCISFCIPNEACDDGLVCTVNDTFDADCICIGIPDQDSDNDGVCDAEDQCPGFDNNLIGTPCDDGESCTQNDVYQSDCTCLGTPTIDSDNDGICDANDLAPNDPCTADGIIDGIEPAAWVGYPNGPDLDDDGIPSICDDCIDVNENGICDENDPDVKLKLNLSHERGYYNDPFQLTIGTNDPNATIRYTLNNSKPSANSGTIYSGPINVNSSTYLRVYAYSGDKETKVITHSYIFYDQIINSNVMENYVTQDLVYGPQMESSLSALPVVSLVSNQISSGAISTEKETSVEMFWPDGSRKGFMLHSGIQTWGGSPTNPKKAFRLIFKEIYGDKKLKYNIFKPDNYDNTNYEIPPAEEFDKLLLRAGSQDGLNGEFGNEKRAQFIRNRFLFDLQIGMGQPAPHGRYVHVFLNGEYRGQYHLLERPDESFFESYLGDEKENYEVRKSGKYSNGNGSMFNSLAANINLSSEANIASTKRYVDLENAATYTILMSLASGFDFSLNHNSLAGGHKQPGNGGYKFLLWDVDLSLGNGGKWDPSYSGNVNYFASPDELGPIPSGLTNNTEFKFIMADQMECACYNDGILTPQKVNELYSHRVDQISTSLISESARWGNNGFSENGNVNVSQWNVNNHFMVEANRMRNTFLPQRLTNLINYFKNNNLISGLSAVQYNQYGGEVGENFQLVLTNPNGNSEIYYTLDGSDPRSVGGGISNSAILYSGPISLPNDPSTVKARIRSNSGNNSSIDKWSGLCPRTFYANQNYSDLIINEIHYNPLDSIFFNNELGAMDTVGGKNFEFIEIKNIGNQTVYLTDASFVKGVSLEIEGSIAVPAGGFAVFVDDETWFEAKYGFAPDGRFTGKLSDDGEVISLVNPLGEVIDSILYNNANPWDEAPDGKGFSLELINPFLNNDDPLNWFRSDDLHGTPGAENSRICNNAALPIVINEINYNSNNILLDPGNWVELYNPNAVEVNLSGWGFYDNNGEFVFPEGTILDPNQYLVLVENDSLFSLAFPNINASKYIGDLPFGLSKKGERISLFDQNKCLSDYVIYNDKAPWPEAPDGNGSTLSLLDPALDNALPASWESSVVMSSNFEFGSPTVSNVCSPGESCNDGDPCTINDTFDVDCNCIGTITDDTDQDGFCNLIDQCPNFDDALIGTPCDDDDECTIGEFYDNNCNCSGGVFQDIDDDEVCDANDQCPDFDDALIGTPCDDGDACTTGETYDENCGCSGGVVEDDDNDGVCNPLDQCDNFDDALIGTPCDDGEVCTTGEIYDANCGCSGGVVEDEDNDGICNPLDNCNNNLEGTPCEDGDICTTGETYDANCNCTGGVFQDADNDSICDADDICPNLENNLLGQLCDDGDPLTQYDTYNTNTCGCSGIIASADICVRVSSSEDDAEEQVDNGVVTISSGDLDMVNDEGVLFITGLRFRNINIPQGATITNATIQFAADEVNTVPTSLIIRGESSDNAIAFSAVANNITNRTTTIDSVIWEPTPWNTIGENLAPQQTIDLSPIIQEIISRPDFVQGNAISFIIEGTGIRTAESFDGSSLLAPELCITYSTGQCVLNYPCDDGDPNTINDAFNANCDCVGENILLNAKVLLEGFYDNQNNNMHTLLNDKDLIPLSQPYNVAPWNYAGDESVASIPNNAVDWILLISRDQDGNILDQSAGFINQDGELMNLDGTLGIPILEEIGNNFSIHHRSHLAILSSNAYNGGIYDFTTSADQAEGNEQLKLVNGKYMLYAGDYDGIGIINSMDFNNWKIQGAIINQYLPIDGDGNGIVNSLDYNLWTKNKSKIGHPIIRY